MDTSKSMGSCSVVATPAALLTYIRGRRPAPAAPPGTAPTNGEPVHLNLPSKKTKYTLNGSAKPHNEGPGDKRSRRILNAGIFTKGVEAYRSQLSKVTASANKVSKVTASANKRSKVTASTNKVPPQTFALCRVLARPRPLFQHEAAAGEWDSVTRVPHGGLALHEGTEQVKRNKGLMKVLRHHVFGKVQAVSTDVELYRSTSDLLSQALRGNMSTIFMYGMTGSGKTYSMDALHRQLPVDIFAQIDGAGAPSGPPHTTPSASPHTTPTVRFHAYELLGKRCFDLTDDPKPNPNPNPKRCVDLADNEGAHTTKTEVFLRVGADGMTNMRGITEHEVSSPDALLERLRAAVARRETSATGANAASSRSHAVYVLLLPGGGRLTLIDLAGSEAGQETLFHTKEHMMQSKEINNSLATLRACLCARSAGACHVPYRESTLTRVLKDALTDATAATALVACVSPACSHLEHSLRTLRTAMSLTGARASAVTVTEQELKDPSVVRGGPKRWTANDLATWLTKQQPFSGKVLLSEGMTGAAIMKLPCGRLKPMCGGDAVVAKALFQALRVASKAAARRDLELRRQLKNGGGKQLDRAAGFAKCAPAIPKVAAKTEAKREKARLRKRIRARRAENRAKHLSAMQDTARRSMANGDMTQDEYTNWCFKHNMHC